MLLSTIVVAKKKQKKLLKKLKQLVDKAIAVQANVADNDSVQALMKTAIEEFGSIDILVNNAGITRDNLLMRMKEDEWDDVINTNLKRCIPLYKSCYTSNDETTCRSYY